jgi:hypothetical protein
MKSSISREWPFSARPDPLLSPSSGHTNCPPVQFVQHAIRGWSIRNSSCGLIVLQVFAINQ